MKRYLNDVWKSLLCLTAAGCAFATSCSSEQVGAVLAGIQVATDELSNSNDQISFGDWLASELNN
jgi:hypothetical protein